MKKTKEKKISFLTKKKDINDKFFDLVGQHITYVRYKKKGGKKWLFKKKGVTKLAKELTITTATLNNYIKTGKVRDNGGMLFTRIESNFKKLKKPKTKKVTKQFTTHNFTEDNFFTPPKLGRRKKTETYFFTVGLYMQFGTKQYYKKKGIIKEKQTLNTYTIQNLPITHYSDNLKQGTKDVWSMINEELKNHPSLNYFIVNYFDVRLIDISK